MPGPPRPPSQSHFTPLRLFNQPYPLASLIAPLHSSPHPTPAPLHSPPVPSTLGSSPRATAPVWCTTTPTPPSASRGAHLLHLPTSFSPAPPAHPPPCTPAPRHPELPPLTASAAAAPRLAEYLEKPRLVSTAGRKTSQVQGGWYLATWPPGEVRPGVYLVASTWLELWPGVYLVASTWLEVE